MIGRIIKLKGVKFADGKIKRVHKYRDASAAIRSRKSKRVRVLKVVPHA